MLEAQHFTAAAEPKGSYALPAEYDGTVNETVLYHAVRAFQNNQRQGTASTKGRSEVRGGGPRGASRVRSRVGEAEQRARCRDGRAAGGRAGRGRCA